MALPGPEYYTEFSRLVRSYLGNRFDLDFGTVTAAEARGLLQPLPPAWSAEWVRLIHRADVVRFDAQDPPVGERLDDLETLRRKPPASKARRRRLLTFEEPIYFVFLALIPLLFFLKYRWKGRGGRLPFPLGLWQGLRFRPGIAGMRIVMATSNFALWLTFVFLVTALAGPSLTRQEKST